MGRLPSQRGFSGFTLVELLVTIILAGIAFAALVPVFVQAQKTGSGDKARLVAVNLAQSQIELIRDLPYDQINESFLTGDTQAARDAGITTESSAQGDGKTYTVAFDVEYVYKTQDKDGAWIFTPYQEDDRPTDVVEAYKQVTVDVVWRGAPSPAKHSVLKTAVYRKVLGSQITRMVVSPLTTLPSGDVGIMTATGPVTIAVDISTYDWLRTTSVLFEVQGPDGKRVASGEVPVDTDQEPVVSWNWTWTSDTKPADGLYTFIATAKDDRGNLGNEWRLWFVLETGPPPAPSDVTCIRGRDRIILQWTKPVAGDLTGFEIGRTPSPSQAWPSLPVWSAMDSSNVTYPSAFIDRLVNADTSYQYVVRARDLGQIPSADAPASADALPAGSPLRTDLTPPAAPTGLQLSNSSGKGGSAVSLGPAIAITWTGSSSSDVRYYAVYRDSTWAAPLACVPCSGRGGTFTVVDKKAGWGSTHVYTVRAMDLALNESGDTASGSVTVPPAPVGQEFDLRIEVSGSYGAQVTIQSLADYLSYPMNSSGNSQNPTYVAYLNSHGNKTWKKLPYGMYRVRVVFNGPSGLPLDARSVVEDIELYQNTPRTYQAPN